MYCVAIRRLNGAWSSVLSMRCLCKIEMPVELLQDGVSDANVVS